MINMLPAADEVRDVDKAPAPPIATPALVKASRELRGGAGNKAVEGSSRGFDQPFHAAIARLAGGISPLALGQAYADWAQHLLLSPDKQIELARKAAEKWERLLGYCVRICADLEQ